MLKKWYILAKFARKTDVFHQKIAREWVSFFQKKCKRKGTVSETVLAHPHTKIRQVPPGPLDNTLLPKPNIKEKEKLLYNYYYILGASKGY